MCPKLSKRHTGFFFVYRHKNENCYCRKVSHTLKVRKGYFGNFYKFFIIIRLRQKTIGRNFFVEIFETIPELHIQNDFLDNLKEKSSYENGSKSPSKGRCSPEKFHNMMQTI